MTHPRNYDLTHTPKFQHQIISLHRPYNKSPEEKEKSYTFINMIALQSMTLQNKTSTRPEGKFALQQSVNIDLTTHYQGRKKKVRLSST
jgi:hypothetical protein